jgi:hypothetical protein
MADIDIASPGANEAALKAALGVLLGRELLDAVAVSAATHRDFTLPAGYVKFELEFVDLSCSDTDFPAAALSPDAGSTFFNDAFNADTYAAGQILFSAPPNTADSLDPRFRYDDDGLIDFCPGLGASGGSFDGILHINPGSASAPPKIRSSAFVIGPTFAANGNNGTIAGDTWYSLNLGATTAPTLARVNLIRVKPYDDGAAAAGTHTMTGTLLLFGVPSP